MISIPLKFPIFQKIQNNMIWKNYLKDLEVLLKFIWQPINSLKSQKVIFLFYYYYFIYFFGFKKKLKKTQKKKSFPGYAYVSFYHRSEAQNALNQLNGYGYDNLILSVEWSV